jgi:hypothetical protein
LSERWERRDAKREKRTRMGMDGRSTKRQYLERYQKKRSEIVRSKERRAIQRGDTTWE